MSLDLLSETNLTSGRQTRRDEMRIVLEGFCDDFVMAAKPFIYQFDNVRVEVNEFRVFKNGETVALEPKAFAVLVFLIENRGRLVTKDELLDAAWKDAFVTPNVLTRIIAQIRRALGDASNNPRYIETVPTRGYRFVPEVNETEAEKSRDKADKTLAVLPFKLLNPSDENNYLGVGLADSLITKLSSVQSLIVRPTSSILRYAKEDCEATESGRELKVETVIDGAVQQANDRVRVSVRLLRVWDGKTLWAETYDAQFVNIFQVQDEISARAAEALKIQLTSDEQTRLTRRPTDNLEAYQLYLRGNFHLYQYTPGDLQKALQFFNEAVLLDAAYALAYAGLANAYGIASSFGDDAAALRAESAAEKAVRLDPALAEAHAALGAMFFWRKRDAVKARKSFDRALELNQNSSVVHHFYSWFLTATARFDDAIRHLRRALELDPLSLTINVDTGLPFYFSRRFAEARERYAKALELDANFWIGHMRLAEACEALNDTACAIKELTRAAVLSGNNPEVKALLARALALAGKNSEARRLLNELMTKDAPSPQASPYHLALAFIALGEKDKAFAMLERALAEKDKWLGWTKVDPRLDVLRPDVRFESFLQH